MSLETKRELTVAISERYRAADRKSKKAILDEFAKGDRIASMLSAS